MPAVFRYVYKHDVMRFAKLATRVWGCQMDFDHPERTALEGIDANILGSLCTPSADLTEFVGKKVEVSGYFVYTITASSGVTYNYVAFATVDKNTKAYILYSDVDYTKEISRGTLTSNDYSTELNNILSKLPTKDSLNKYKYTFTVKNCPYQEYCYVSGEWVK